MCKKQSYENITSLKEFWDNRGSLLPLNFDQLPFVPKRSFIIRDVPNGTIRGQHAHYKCKQFFICLNGNIIIHINNKKESMYYSLKTYDAIYIPEIIWSSQKFYDNGIALVFASELYDEQDYIRNFGDFINEQFSNRI